KRNQIEGLTTAASILLTSAIGIAVAIGSLMLAAGVTALTVIVLVCVGWIEDIMNRNRNQRDAGN
ncbi:MAG: MgtC/SapB family protein, partial [bacterium]|nr:MgtC/SapB family protein [bacterium]